MLYQSQKRSKELIAKKQLNDDTDLSNTLQDLTKILKPSDSDEQWSDYEKDDNILTCLKLIGKEMKMKVIKPKSYEKDKKTQNPVWVIAKASKFRAREVLLRNNWHKKQNGHLLVFKQEEDSRPLALIQQNKGGYIVKDPQSSTSYP